MDCPQSPSPPEIPIHAYPSPRSKSPPPPSRSKLFLKLPSLEYPLSDNTNLSLAQAMFECMPSTPRLGEPEIRHEQDENVAKGGRLGVASTHDTAHCANVLRSPIPLLSSSTQLRSPHLEPAQTPNLISSPLTVCPSNSPPPLFRAFATPDTPKYKRRWTKHRLLLNPDPAMPIPGFGTRRARKHLKRSPPSPSLLPSRPRLQQHSSALPPPVMLPPQPFLPLSLELRKPQGQTHRAKREQAEHNWLVKMHRSLAWRVNMQHAVSQDEEEGSDDGGPWTNCVEKEKDTVQGFAMNLESEGLMIALSGPPAAECACVTAEPRWTDELDRRLVVRLREKLIANEWKHPGPTIPQLNVLRCSSEPGIPFPTLAPPIQLEPPSIVPRRPRVSAPVSSPRPAQRRSAIVSACEFPLSQTCPVTPPKGILAPAQLVAQTMFRRAQARAKPIRRGSAPQGRRSRSMLGTAAMI